MSQNWFPGQAGYGQQPWGHQQQVPGGWVQGGPRAGGQWAGQPHPQQHPGYYGGQQQMMAMGYPQGFPPGAQRGPYPQPHPQPHPQLHAHPQPHPQPQVHVPPQLQQQQQFAQQSFQQQQKVFQSQQAYAQEREKQAREEQKRQELKMQKQKLQNIDFSKPKVNLDDLFEKQIPESKKPPPKEVFSSPVSAHLTAPPSSGGSDMSLPTSGGVDQSRGEERKSTERDTTPESKPDKAETYQKLMAESLQNITDAAPKKKTQFSTPFKRPAKKETHVQTQSKKARSWDAASEDFSGIFAQPNPPTSEPDDAFGDFQSSLETTGSEFTSLASSTLGQSGLSMQTLPTAQQPQTMANTVLPPSGPLGGVPYSSPQHFNAGQVSTQQFPGQGVAYNQHGGNMIATSAYGGPLSSSVVVIGMQGQSPNAPQAQLNFQGPPLSHTAAANSHQPSSFPMASPPPFPPQHHPQPPSYAHQQNSTGPITPQTANIGPPAPESHAPSPPNVESPQFHPVYYKVYRRCTKPGQDLVSTDILYPVLLSSKLSRVQLRNLWSIANRGTPGRLTQMELFVLLGLVALAQGGNPSPTLEDLKRAPSIPVPTLPALSTLPSQPSSEQETQGDDFGEFHAPPMATPPVNPPMATPPVNPPMATPPVNPPMATPPVNPPMATPPLNPPMATPPVNPPMTTPPVNPPMAAPPVNPPSIIPPQPVRPEVQPPLQPTVTTHHPPAPVQPLATGTAQPDLQAQPVLQGSLMDRDVATSSSNDKYAVFKILQPDATTTLSSTVPTKPDLPVQPVSQASLLDADVRSGDKYAAFSDLRTLQPESPATLQPQSSEDKYSTFRTLDTPSNASSETSSLSGDKYSAFDTLRPSTGPSSLPPSSLSQPPPPQSSPQLLLPQPVTQSRSHPPQLTPSPPLLPHTQTPPLVPPLQPISSSQPPSQPQVPTSETTSAPPKIAVTHPPQSAYIPSRFSPPPLSPEEPVVDQKGTKSGQPSQHPPTFGSTAMTTQKEATVGHSDDGFGEFAQFSFQATSQPVPPPTTGFSFPPPTASIPSSGPSPTPPPTASSSALGVSLHLSSDAFGSQTSQESNQLSSEGGWADFTQFETTSTPQTLQSSESDTTTSLQPVSAASPLVSAAFGGSGGDLGLLTAPTTDKTHPEVKELAPPRRGGFEFRPIGSKESPRSTPTIDDLERELLSKLSTAEVVRPGGEEEFGDFEDHSKKKKLDQPVDKSKTLPSVKRAQPQVSASEQWRMCLSKCEEVLGVCVGVLGEVEEESLLLEIVQSEEAKNKLHGIAEVYRFAKRIYCTLRSKDPSSSVSVADGVQEKWKELNRLVPNDTLNKIYSATASTNHEPTDVLSDTVSHCALCLMTKTVTIPSSFSLDGEEEEYQLAMLFHNGQTYHAPCANFWSNVVVEELPVLG